MATENLIPLVGFVNETITADNLVPLGGFVNETVSAGGGGGTIYERSASDGLMMLDPDSRDRSHQQSEGLPFGDGLTRDQLKLLADQVLLQSAQYCGIDKVIQTGLLFNDELRLERFLQFVDFLLLGSDGTTSLAGTGQEYTVARGDGLYFLDQSIHDRAMQVIDGLMLDEARFFDRFLGVLTNLLLGYSASTQITFPGQNTYERSATDILLTDDGRVSDLSLVLITRMLLSDIGMTEALKMRESLDGLLMYSMPRALTIELNQSDRMLLNDVVTQFRELLWNEGLFLKSSVERLVLGAVLDYLVYARLRTVDFMSIQYGANGNFLGWRTGINRVGDD